MKTTIVRLTLLCGIASTSSGAFAQYYVPPAARPTATYRSPGAAATAVPQSAYRSNAPAAAYTAARQVPAARAAQPAAAPMTVPTFRPINPPSTRPAAQARPAPSSRQAPWAMVANRPTNAPTPAPAPIRSASKAQVGPAAAPSAGSTYAPSMSGMGWNAPTPSMPMDSGVNGYGMAGGPAPAPVADPGIDYSYGDGGYGGDCGCDGGCGHRCGLGCGHRCGCCLSAIHQHGLCIPCKTTGDLVPHMPFFGTTHGYYYFRPYHVMHVFSQQELATRWGGDPRNPYDNTMFTRIYEQMGVEARPIVKGAPTPMPAGGPEYVSPGSTVSPTPTPVPMYGDPTQTYTPPASGMTPPAVTPLPGVETLAPPTR